MALLSATCADLGSLEIGDQLFRRYEVRDKDKALTNSTIVATMTLPNGTVVNLTVVNESVGVYLVTFPPFTVRGVHYWRVAATGPVFKVERGTLRVAA